MRRLTVITLFLILVTSPAYAQNALGPSMYDHTTPQIIYSGVVWSSVVDSNNYGGSRYTSGQVTSTAPRVDFSIWGNGFTIYIYRNSIGANADLCVNSVCTGITYYNPTNQYYQITITDLGYGTHTVSIIKTSTTSTQINMDALYVEPPPIPPTVIPPTPVVVVTLNYPTSQPTPTGTQYAYAYIGNWDDMPESTDDPSIIRFDVDDSEGNPTSVALVHRVDAGQIGGMVLQVASVVMLMVIFITLVRKKSP